MLSIGDYAVIVFYLVFMLSVGWFFRKFGENSSEYFRGGGKMPWWMVGAATYMGSFSAWTFTGAAGLAYGYGIVVFVIYWSTAVAGLFSWAFAAARLRQTRCVTVMEIVRARLGPANEQFFSWLSMPVGIFVAGIWLYGLAIFCAPVFGIKVQSLICICGCVAMFLAASGGSWAVIAGHFMQCLVLVPIGLITAVVAWQKAGGWSALSDRLPATHWDISASGASEFGKWWIVSVLLEKFFSLNSINGGGPKFLPVKDGASARKAALLTAVLTFIGPLLWFIPPLLARTQATNLTGLFPNLARASEGAYIAMASQVLPVGLTGIMVTAIMSATMSSMDSGLNANAGIFVRSVYVPLFRPAAPEKEQVFVGRICTLVFGVLIILMALFYSTWKEMSLFNLMLTFTAMLTTPGAIIMFWSLWIKRTPDWAAWTTVLAGMIFNASIGLIAKSSWALSLPGTTLGKSLSWMRSPNYPAMTLGSTVFCTAFFLATSVLFRNRIPPRRKVEIESFFQTITRPLSDAEMTDREDLGGLRKVGVLCFVYAGFILALMLLPNKSSGRFQIALCSAALATVGGLLIRFVQKRIAGAPAIAQELSSSKVSGVRA